MRLLSLAVIAAVSVLALPLLGRAEPPLANAALSSDAYAALGISAAAERLFPGDEVEILVPSAPELSRVVTIAPDGSIGLPLAGTVVISGQTSAGASARASAAYRSILLRPEVQVLRKAFGSQQVFVGGEVARPGVYDISGPLDPLQAITLAGGFTKASDRRAVRVIRKTTNDDIVSARFDAVRAVKDPNQARRISLQRYDVIYVPKSGIAQLNDVVSQYLKESLPVGFGLYYGLD